MELDARIDVWVDVRLEMEGGKVDSQRDLATELRIARIKGAGLLWVLVADVPSKASASVKEAGMSATERPILQHQRHDMHNVPHDCIAFKDDSAIGVFENGN